MSWSGVAAVLIGGGIGSVIRYAMTFAISQRLGPGFPWWTFAINMTGSFVIGAVYELTQTREFGGGTLIRSTFSLETLQLIGDRAQLLAFAYAAGSVLLGVVAAYAGVVVMRAFSAA